MEETRGFRRPAPPRSSPSASLEALEAARPLLVARFQSAVAAASGLLLLVTTSVLSEEKGALVEAAAEGGKGGGVPSLLAGG